ncbi:MAG: DUF882 domain-containing protein [Pseudomonadales bacterium]|jgi:uncharacterized protein YcbK (DUF882 family)|nr:DUF882 domain-containing protein [Pseudomonadales bacterium]
MIGPKRLSTALLVVAGLASHAPAAAKTTAERSLAFRHLHTAETLDIVYWRDDDYVPEALAAINAFLRDWRTDDATVIDPELLDLLHQVYEESGSRGRFEVISAYRSPRTNEMLRSSTSGVAKRSQHLLGKAIDVRLTDVPISRLRKIAYGLARGGVGFYERSNFVHLDTGRFRTW